MYLMYDKSLEKLKDLTKIKLIEYKKNYIDKNGVNIKVKKVNRINSLNYYELNINGFNYNIMICGTWHNYCYNKSFCDPFSEYEYDSYDLLDLIKIYSKNQCIDVFSEVPFDNRIKIFQKLKSKINYQKKLLSIENIKTVEERNEKEKQQLVETLVMMLKTIDTMYGKIKDSCLPHKNVTIDIFNKIIDFVEKDDITIIQSFSNKEIINILKYLDYMIENDLVKKTLRNKEHKNIRYHFWDIRNIDSKQKKNISPYAIFPWLLNMYKESGIISGVNLNEYTLFYENIKKKNNIYTIVYYLMGINNKNYTQGRELYKTLYEKLKLEDFEDYEEKKIKKYQSLFQKQYKKSIFNKDINFFEKVEQFYSSILKIKIIFEDHISTGIVFTDIYNILRMFKLNIKNKSNRIDNCIDNSYFKNIISVGGEAHAQSVVGFINFYFKIKPKIVGKSQLSHKRCVEFEEEVEFFNK